MLSCTSHLLWVQDRPTSIMCRSIMPIFCELLPLVLSSNLLQLWTLSTWVVLWIGVQTNSNEVATCKLQNTLSGTRHYSLFFLSDVVYSNCWCFLAFGLEGVVIYKNSYYVYIVCANSTLIVQYAIGARRDWSVSFNQNFLLSELLFHCVSV